MNDIKCDLGGVYSALSDNQRNMGTLKGNLDVLQEELGGKINTLRKEVDSTVCKIGGNLTKTMGSLTQKLDMLCALVPQGQGSLGSNSTLNDSNRRSPRGFAQQSAPNQGRNPSPPGVQSGTLAPSPVQHSTPYTAQLGAQGESVPPKLSYPIAPAPYGCGPPWRVPEFGWADRNAYCNGSKRGNPTSPRPNVTSNSPRSRVSWGSFPD
jgi:hypothetical protein